LGSIATFADTRADGQYPTQGSECQSPRPANDPMPMLAGEYVSVSSLSDTADIDLARERQELIDLPNEKLEVFAAAFVERDVSKQLLLKSHLEHTHETTCSR